MAVEKGFFEKFRDGWLDFLSRVDTESTEKTS